MKYDVYGIGNALVDMIYNVDDSFFTTNDVEKSLMTLIEEEKQNELVDKLSTEPSAQFISRSCGGSAANTMIGVAQFGGTPFYSCKVANDETGLCYLNDLKASGVDTKLNDTTAPTGTTGKCLVMVSPDAERTMNTYLGVTASFSTEELDHESIKNSEWIYIEGYLVASPTGQLAALETLDIAKKNNVKTSVTMSDVNMVKFFRDNIMAIVENGVDLIFTNEIEAFEFAQSTDIEVAKEALQKVAKTFVITLGDKGALVYDGQNFIDIAPCPTEAIDSNGAGDMFAGAYLYGITHGHSIEKSAQFACLASSKVVSIEGPRLSSTEAVEILLQLAS